MNKILVVDDELSLRELLQIMLEGAGYQVWTVGGVRAAIAALDDEEFDLVLTDMKMPDGDGMEVLQHALKVDPAIQVLIMTAFASAQTAVDAMKAGARDYVIKPFDSERLMKEVGKALEVRHLERENLYLRQELAARGAKSELIGASKPMEEIHSLVARVAPTKANVLISGESGTGKELLAHAIHNQSDRAPGPFIAVNCGAIPESLVESELFGHVKGAFTGAAKDRRGLFFAADGGTLFLDEIGELPLAMQVRLLRVLQERKVKRVGSELEEPVDVRIVAASNRDLQEEVASGNFREDLFYRLNVIQLQLPALRDRKDDIPLLVRHFLSKFRDSIGRDIRGVDSAAMEALMAWDWPGNVRELENVMERAVTLAWEDMITLDALPPAMQEFEPLPQRLAAIDLPPEGCNLDELISALEQRLMLQALERSGNNRTEAARILGISFRSMRYRLRKYDLISSDDDGEDEP